MILGVTTNRHEWLTATSPVAKVKCSSTKSVTTEGWLQKETLRGSSWKVPPWLSLQLSAAPPSSGMYDSAQVSVGLGARLPASTSRDQVSVQQASRVRSFLKLVVYWGRGYGGEAQWKVVKRRRGLCWPLSVPGRSCSTFA